MERLPLKLSTSKRKDEFLCDSKGILVVVLRSACNSSYVVPLVHSSYIPYVRIERDMSAFAAASDSRRTKQKGVWQFSASHVLAWRVVMVLTSSRYSTISSVTFANTASASSSALRNVSCHCTSRTRKSIMRSFSSQTSSMYKASNVERRFL